MNIRLPTSLASPKHIRLLQLIPYTSSLESATVEGTENSRPLSKEKSDGETSRAVPGTCQIAMGSEQLLLTQDFLPDMIFI